MLFLALLSSLALQDAAELQGAWLSAEEGPTEVIWFDGSRVGWLRGDEPTFYRAEIEAGHASLESWGRFIELEVHTHDDGAGLHVEGDGYHLALERCEVPRALLVEPYDWPTDIALDADTVAELTDELARRRDEDQRVRQFGGQPTSEEMSEMGRVDADNVAFLMQVVEELGWIDAERFGTAAADAAFLIVQHAPDTRLMRSALPHIEADVRAGRLGSQAYALLHDRFELRMGRLQRYGSQIGVSPQFGSVLMPCEDFARLDELRGELGMGPIADYLEFFKDGPDAPGPRHLPELRAEARALPAEEPATDEGWTALFNGRDLSGWRVKIRGHALDDNFGDTFRVVDGLLRVSYDQYDSFDGRFGHLIYDAPFSHYRLRIEYRFLGQQAKGGPGWAFRNSGVMLHGQAPDSMTLEQEFPVSIEAQMLGGPGQGERPTANLCTPGTHVVMQDELVRRHCTNSSSETYHGDGWVQLEIEVHGDESIRHYVEGELVLEYSAPQLDENDPDAQRLLASGAARALTSGYLSLQAESHPIEFRRVEIRELE